jgi:hypothetical protein
MKFLEFAAGCGYTLTEAQLEYARVAFDRERPSTGPIAKQLWGAESPDDDTWVPSEDAAYSVVAAVCGRGSGKSLLAGLRVLHLAATVDVSRLGRGERALCPIVAPDMATAGQVLRFALGAAEAIGLNVIDVSSDGFTIRRKGKQTVRIEVRSASARGSATRGFSMPCAVLDESAFFRDAQHKVNDQEIFDSLRPRLMAGGQIILLSSPWSENGLLYDLFKQNYGHPVDALVAHAPTGLMRPDDDELQKTIAALRRSDPEKAAREFDAIFMSINTAAFFDHRALTTAVSKSALKAEPTDTVGLGGDFAFRRNSSAFAAVSLGQHSGNYFADPDLAPVFRTIGLLERKPLTEPLKPSVVCHDAADFAKAHNTDTIIADGHYREAVAEHLWDGGNITLTSAPEGAAGKAEVFQLARGLLLEGRVKLPDPDSSIEAARLMAQLREVALRPLAGGGVAIESPLWKTGEHGDLVSAWVLGVWRASKLGWTAPEEKKPGTPDELERDLMNYEAERAEKAQRVNRAIGMSRLRRV